MHAAIAPVPVSRRWAMSLMHDWIYDFEPEWGAYVRRDFAALAALLAPPEDVDRAIAGDAVKEGHADLVLRLLAAGANPNASEEARIGNTPIREAVHYALPEIVALLLRHGADPTIPGWMAISAVDEAHFDVLGGCDSDQAKAIQRLLAPFPSAVRDRAQPPRDTA